MGADFAPSSDATLSLGTASLTWKDLNMKGTVNMLDGVNDGARFYNSANYVELRAPGTLAANRTFTLPNADGTSGQFMTTNGSGVLSFASAPTSAIVKVASLNIASSNTIDFSTTTLGSISGDFYFIKIDGINPATSNVNLLFEISSNNLSSFATVSFSSNETRFGTSTNVILSSVSNTLVSNMESQGPSPATAGSGYIILPTYNANIYNRLQYMLTVEKTAATGGLTLINGNGLDGTPTNWNSFRFRLSSGNFSNRGVVNVYRYA